MKVNYAQPTTTFTVHSHPYVIRSTPALAAWLTYEAKFLEGGRQLRYHRPHIKWSVELSRTELAVSPLFILLGRPLVLDTRSVVHLLGDV